MKEQEFCKENYFYHPDHLGSSSWIREKSGYSAQHLHYLPWGEDFVDQRTTNYAARFTFSAKEKDAETGFSYFGSRYYNSDLSIWLSVDPMSDKYPSLSPYVYCANNPVKLVDPNGEEIEVSINDNGTYTVVGGTLNSDRNIYIVKDGKRTGDILGQTMTDYSFFSEEGNVVEGAIINPADNSGQEFLDGLKSNNPSLITYMFNAAHGKKYDFKVQGGADNKNVNRGMPINVDGKTVFASARDVGNYAAGYVSGRKGLSWTVTRLGFDGYQTGIKNAIKGNWITESNVSQSAQKLGFNAGVKQYNKDKTFQMQLGPLVPHLKR